MNLDHLTQKIFENSALLSFYLNYNTQNPAIQPTNFSFQNLSDYHESLASARNMKMMQMKMIYTQNLQNMENYNYDLGLKADVPLKYHIFTNLEPSFIESPDLEFAPKKRLKVEGLRGEESLKTEPLFKVEYRGESVLRRKNIKSEFVPKREVKIEATLKRTLKAEVDFKKNTKEETVSTIDERSLSVLKRENDVMTESYHSGLGSEDLIIGPDELELQMISNHQINSLNAALPGRISNNQGEVFRPMIVLPPEPLAQFNDDMYTRYLRSELEKMILFLLSTMGKKSQNEVENVRKIYQQDPNLSAVFDKLVMKYYSAKKCKEDIVRYIIRRAFKTIRNEFAKREYVFGKKASTLLCKTYFQNRLEEIEKAGINIENEDDIVDFIMPYKKILKIKL